MNRNIELLEFLIEDLDDMTIKYHKGESIKDFKERLKGAMKLGHSRLIRYKDKPLAIMGYTILWPGVCELWVMPNEPIEDKGVLALSLKYSLEIFVLPQEFHRIQATVLDNDPSEGFLIKLGFECEGLLRKYDTFKQNYKMWARVQL
jgi:hypothetical protein